MTEEQWKNFTSTAFTGFDFETSMLRISTMNLMLHSITDPHIEYKDSVSKQNQIRGKYSICLANPPFKGNVDAEGINDDLKAVANTKKTELLFVALFVRMLEKGGRCACIVPDGVLFGSSKAHKAIRQELVENQQLQAVISMPSGVFKPYAGVSSSAIITLRPKRTESARIRVSSFRRTRLPRTTMTCLSTNTKKLSMCQLSIRLRVR